MALPRYMSHTEIFTDIYEREYWGQNLHPAYRGSSGSGSAEAYNEAYIAWVRDFFQTKNIESVVDVGCGDFRCGPATYNGLNISYVGLDVYEPMIAANSIEYPTKSFRVLDCYTNRSEIPAADLCILKDVLQHWSNEEVYNFLDEITASKKFKYILICNCSRQKRIKDTRTGHQRQLSADFFPLKKYNPTKVFTYDTKEVSLIEPSPT